MTTGPNTEGTILATLPADKLASVVDGWMWEFEEAQNWPTRDQVRRAMTEIEQRADRHTAPVRLALAKCEDYLSSDACPG